MKAGLKELIKKNKAAFIALQKIRFSLNRIFRPKAFYFLLNSRKPLSHIYGLDRGRPIDRYYIENFLAANANLITGRCLELLNNDYTKKFGGVKVAKSEVLDIDRANRRATVYGDLRNLSEISDKRYDCLILTQVFQFIDDLPAAINECYRILKPGGALLATLPALSRIDNVAGVNGDYWRFTKASATHLFKKHFSADNLEIRSLGNLLAAINFLAGISLEETNEKQLDFNDEDFPCLITVKAIK